MLRVRTLQAPACKAANKGLLGAAATLTSCGSGSEPLNVIVLGGMVAYVQLRRGTAARPARRSATVWASWEVWGKGTECTDGYAWYAVSTFSVLCSKWVVVRQRVERVCYIAG